MKTLIRKLARACMPAALHRFLYAFVFRCTKLPKIRDFYRATKHDSEIDDLLARLSKEGEQVFLYPWAKSVHSRDVEVFRDETNQLPFVMMNEKRLYFPRTLSRAEIQNCYASVQLIEQHPNSPHRYLADDFTVDASDCVVDCGAAEGNFSLSVVDRVKRVYLFEADEQWIEALRATFAPWRDKVEIIQKFVSDENRKNFVSLDSFFANKEPPTFLKMDIEGCEQKTLAGAREILTKHVKKVALCAYHYAHDEETLSRVMREFSFTVQPAPGYMFFNLYDNEQPYFRRGVLRCTKQSRETGSHI